MFGNISVRKRLFKKNKEYWDKEKKPIETDKEWVCVYHSLAWHLELSMLLDLIAKGIQKKEHLPIIAFSYGDSNESFVEGDLSFGIEAKEVGYCDNSFFSQTRVVLMSKFASFWSYQKKDRLLKLKFRGIPCGNAIWDQIVWIEQCNNFKMISRKQYKECLTNAFTIMERAVKELSRYKPKYLVIDEWVRIPALWANVAIHMGAEIVNPDLDHANHICIYKGRKTTGEGICANYLEAVLQHFLDKTTVDVSGRKDPFLYKMHGEKSDEIVDEIPLDNGKRNVFIMLSGFSDAARHACKHLIYKDYIEWFKDTLQKVSCIEGVNWIVRNHPFTAGNPQEKYVRDICKAYEGKNIYLSSSSLSREQIIQKADAIITYAGDVGIEYWALGIPTVTVGKAYYVSSGISYNMKSIEEYEYTLNHISELNPPDEKQMETARRCIAAMQGRKDTQDELTILFRDIHSKEYVGIQYEQRAYDLYDYEFCEEYMRLLEEDKIYDSACVQLENVICCNYK